MIIPICKAKLLVQGVHVKYNEKAWLSIEDEIVDSMTNAGAKDSIRTWYWRNRKEHIQLAELRHGILRLIKQGYSALKDMDDIQNLYDRKEYYRINKEQTREGPRTRGRKLFFLLGGFPQNGRFA